MSYKLFFWIVSLIILIFAVFTYNFPVEGAALHSEARTAAASTLWAMVTPQSTTTALPTLTMVPPSSTPTSQPTLTSIPTFSVPMLTLRDATNCRTGPGLAYEISVTYPIGQTLEIVGRYEPGNFWLVESGDSATGNCWLWGEFADVSGSYGTVAAVTPPPMPTPGPLYAPSLQKYYYSCDDINSTLSFQMSWADRAGSEASYRIFRDGSLVAELPAGSTNYAETIIMPASRSAEYSVQAHNATGTASMSVKRLTCDE
jgi:hypothetical protein